MATVVGQASAAATSVAFPAHAVGDMLLVFARGTTAAPSVPAASGTVPAWVTLQSGLANSIGLTVGAFVATATTTTTGAWTNATHICVLVLRPASGKKLQTAAANSSVGNANNTQTIVYPALALGFTNGSSTGVRVGTRITAVTAVGTPPTGWTNQSIQPAGASALMSVHTLAALAANPTADSVATAGTNAAYRAVTVEVQEVALAQSLTVGAVASAQSFGASTIQRGRVTVPVAGVYPPGYVSSIVNTFLVDQRFVGGFVTPQFGTPTASLVQLAPAGGVGSAQAFGVLTIKTVARPAPGGVPSAQAFGSPTIKAAIRIPVGGVGSAQAFGILRQTVSVLGVSPPVVLSITGGVISGDGHLCYGAGTQFGFPTLSFSAHVPGLGSAQAFGVLKMGQGRPIGGVNSAQAFGVPTKATAVRIAAAGVASAQSFGAPVFILMAGPQIVGVSGVLPAGTVFSITGHVISGDGHVSGGSGGQFGFVSFSTRVSLPVSGLGSAQVFGHPVGRNVIPSFGVSSAQAFGTPTIKTHITVVVGGVASAQAFGTSLVEIVWLRDLSCLDEDLLPAGTGDLDLSQLVCLSDSSNPSICGGPICGDGHVCGGTEALLDLSPVIDDPLSPVSQTEDDLQPVGCA